MCAMLENETERNSIATFVINWVEGHAGAGLNDEIDATATAALDSAICSIPVVPPVSIAHVFKVPYSVMVPSHPRLNIAPMHAVARRNAAIAIPLSKYIPLCTLSAI